MPEYHSIGKKYSTGDMGKDQSNPIQSDPVATPSIANVGKYLSAEASLQLHGPVTDEVFEDRKRHCVECPSRVLSDKLPDEIGYCRSCGCGVSDRSRLTVKLTMPAASCPMGKWSPSEGRHRSPIERAKSWLAKRLLGA